MVRRCFRGIYNNLKRIVQTDDYVMILAEQIHDARIVRMNQEHAPLEIRYWFGDSVGHWEGDTLVVDTTNFTDTPVLRDASRNLHIVERFTRVDAETLRYQFTIDDPTVWTQPWSGEYPWPATRDRVYEYACHEANYSFEAFSAGRGCSRPKRGSSSRRATKHVRETGLGHVGSVGWAPARQLVSLTLLWAVGLPQGSSARGCLRHPLLIRRPIGVRAATRTLAARLR